MGLFFFESVFFAETQRLVRLTLLLEDHISLKPSLHV